MNSLTLLMFLPIIGSVAVAATPKVKETLTKQVALATTLIVAAATIGPLADEISVTVPALLVAVAFKRT